jgi:hypothetical protein
MMTYRYSSIILQQIEVSGQLRAPAALTLGKQPTVPIVQEDGKLWKRDKSLASALK